jgi:small subunit ribosomal protein S21
MLIVPLREGDNIERALKSFKRKFEKTGVVRNMRAVQFFVKPSIKRRNQIRHAAYKQQCIRNADDAV